VGHSTDPDADVCVVPDPALTEKGREEAARLHEETKDTIQKTGEPLVSSALKGSLQTMVIGYPDLRKRLEAEGMRVIILPQVQEVSFTAGSLCTVLIVSRRLMPLFATSVRCVRPCQDFEFTVLFVLLYVHVASLFM
jgi:hypothetical protein